MEGPISVFSQHKFESERIMATDSTTKSSPWGKPVQNQLPSCLQDVMNDQLSEEFIEKEQKIIEKDFMRYLLNAKELFQ